MESIPQCVAWHGMAWLWAVPSLNYFVLKSLQVGVGTNPPDWFQLCLKELNPEIKKKKLIPAQTWKKNIFL